MQACDTSTVSTVAAVFLHSKILNWCFVPRLQAQVARLEAMAEHLCETAGPDNELLLDIYDRIDRCTPHAKLPIPMLSVA